MGWAVWRRSYLNRNAIAASSGLGRSEQWRRRRGGEGSPSPTTRNGMEPDRDVVIDDGCKGRAQCFCQLNRFVCSFIAHLPGFLLRSIILVRCFLSLNICFSSHFFFFRFFECFLMLLLLQCNDPIPQTRSLLFHFCCYRKRTVLALLLDIFLTEEPLLAESCLRQPFVVAGRWRLVVISFLPTRKGKTFRQCRFYPR